MKKILTGALLVAVVASAVPQAQAGDREWSTAGKVLTGVFAAGVLARAFEPAPTVVYQPAPVYVQSAPVVYQTAPTVVYAQAPAVQTVYYAPAPVVYYSQPVCYAPAPVVSVHVGYGRPVYYHSHGFRRW